MTNLFFDDQRLFARTGTVRTYGKPELIADSFFDGGGGSPSGAFPFVLRDKNGLYTMFYQTFTPEGIYQLAAMSEDGIHFKPRNTAREAGITDPSFENQFLPFMNAELGFIIEDRPAPPEKRFRAGLARYRNERLAIDDIMFSSPDSVHWNAEPGIWNPRGTEPGAGCMWCEAAGGYIITSRPDWGIRRICTHFTRDFYEFTEPRLAVQCDSADNSLDETYGMRIFDYKGWYIGMLWLYHVPESDTWKYHGGTLDCQLAYSFNGYNWLRSLRNPFIANKADTVTAGMVFPGSIQNADDGTILIYASATPHEHGSFNREGASIVVYRLREDGFICLRAEREARIVSRQLLWKEGRLMVNCDTDDIAVGILNAESKPVEGFGCSDCTMRRTDPAHLTPSFAGGDVTDFAGKVITLEIRWKGGSLYSFSGDFINMMNTEAWRFQKFGILPDNRGF